MQENIGIKGTMSQQIERLRRRWQLTYQEEGFFFFFLSVFVTLCENYCFSFFFPKKKNVLLQRCYLKFGVLFCFCCARRSRSAKISDTDFVRCLHFS